MDYVYAFLIGGAICTVAQILIDKTKLTPAKNCGFVCDYGCCFDCNRRV